MLLLSHQTSEIFLSIFIIHIVYQKISFLRDGVWNKTVDFISVCLPRIQEKGYTSQACRLLFFKHCHKLARMAEKIELFRPHLFSVSECEMPEQRLKRNI